VSGWVYAGLGAAGLALGGVVLAAAPLAAVWVAVGLALGRQERAARAAQPAPDRGS
jgi:AAA family ATP:ADP antiporter